MYFSVPYSGRINFVFLRSICSFVFLIFFVSDPHFPVVKCFELQALHHLSFLQIIIVIYSNMWMIMLVLFLH